MGMVIYLRQANTAEIEQIRAAPDTVEEFVFGDGEPSDKLVEFDKAWHALHFMLTGDVCGTGHPLGVIADETPIEGADEQGWGGFAVIDPARMAAFATALAALTDEALGARFDPASMVEADIYIADAFTEEGRDEALEYILQGLPALRRFARSCAEAGDGALRIIA